MVEAGIIPPIITGQIATTTATITTATGPTTAIPATVEVTTAPLRCVRPITVATSVRKHVRRTDLSHKAGRKTVPSTDLLRRAHSHRVDRSPATTHRVPSSTSRAQTKKSVIVVVADTVWWNTQIRKDFSLQSFSTAS